MLWNWHNLTLLTLTNFYNDVDILYIQTLNNVIFVIYLDFDVRFAIYLDVDVMFLIYLDFDVIFDFHFVSLCMIYSRTF